MKFQFEKSTNFCLRLYWKPEHQYFGASDFQFWPNMSWDTNPKLHQTNHSDEKIIIYSEVGKETSFIFHMCLSVLSNSAKQDVKPVYLFLIACICISGRPVHNKYGTRLSFYSHLQFQVTQMSFQLGLSVIGGKTARNFCTLTELKEIPGRD